MVFISQMKHSYQNKITMHLERKEVGDYNDTTYYRANPYAKQGYLPECSLNNRRPQQYAVEMPQGDLAFAPTQRRVYPGERLRSQITDFQILTSPERYPFENREAMSKNLLRNLTTSDIEGASANSKVSRSIKNKLRAQEIIQQRGLSVGITSEINSRQSLLEFTGGMHKNQLSQNNPQEGKVTPNASKDKETKTQEQKGTEDRNQGCKEEKSGVVLSQRTKSLAHLQPSGSKPYMPDSLDFQMPRQSIEFKQGRPASKNKAKEINSHPNSEGQNPPVTPYKVSLNIKSQPQARETRSVIENKLLAHQYVQLDRRNMRGMNPTNLSDGSNLRYMSIANTVKNILAC